VYRETRKGLRIEQRRDFHANLVAANFRELGQSGLLEGPSLLGIDFHQAVAVIPRVAASSAREQ
jgi:hypothetical protein